MPGVPLWRSCAALTSNGTPAHIMSRHAPTRPHGCVGPGSWACHCLEDGEDRGGHDAPTIPVTANLTVDFRAPFPEGSAAVVRVRLDESAGRKMRFSAVLESHDRSVVFAEATSLFVTVPSRKTGLRSD